MASKAFSKGNAAEATRRCREDKKTRRQEDKMNHTTSGEQRRGSAIGKCSPLGKGAKRVAAIAIAYIGMMIAGYGYSSTISDLSGGISDRPLRPLDDLDDLINLSGDSASASASASVTASILPTRANILSNVAMLLGSHKGAAERAAQLIAALEARSNQLDKIYRFGALVNQHSILPPVIIEARDAIRLTNQQMRVADRLYKVATPARFVITPPSWRDYLFVGLSAKRRTEQPEARPATVVLPRTSAERAYWKQQVIYGYQHGRKLADEIFYRNRARLDRDYMGMLRYAELLNKGMVSEPRVSIAQEIVTGNQLHINVGDTLYRITDAGGFITDAEQWQPTIIPISTNTR